MPNSPYTQQIRSEDSKLIRLESQLTNCESRLIQAKAEFDHANYSLDNEIMELNCLKCKVLSGLNTEREFDSDFRKVNTEIMRLNTQKNRITNLISGLEANISKLKQDINCSQQTIRSLEASERNWQSNNSENSFLP